VVTRNPMVLLSVGIVALVLGTDAVAGADTPTSSVRVFEPGTTVLPWSFGGTWEMDLRCTDSSQGKLPASRRAPQSSASSDGRSGAQVPIGTPRNRAAVRESVTIPSRTRAGSDSLAADSNLSPSATAGGHHNRAILVGTRFNVSAAPWSREADGGVMLRDDGQGPSLETGWTRGQLHLAGSVPLVEEVPCDASAEQIVTMIQQQDLLRIEGNVCLGASIDSCHDHFVVIIARRRGSLGPEDRGQLVVFALDAGGQYTTGRRIRSLNDAAAYGGRLLRHLGANHSHEDSGGD
jgi:hypothetical protein